jgi:hypothetical protein
MKYVVEMGTVTLTYIHTYRLVQVFTVFRGGYTDTKTKLHGLSPRANYTDRATAACRRSDCQLVRIEGAMRSA